VKRVNLGHQHLRIARLGKLDPHLREELLHLRQQLPLALGHARQGIGDQGPVRRHHRGRGDQQQLPQGHVAVRAAAIELG
jgi:hypothetical protein